jgi:hypothetical protein
LVGVVEAGLQALDDVTNDSTEQLELVKDACSISETKVEKTGSPSNFIVAEHFVHSNRRQVFRIHR